MNKFIIALLQHNVSTTCDIFESIDNHLSDHQLVVNRSLTELQEDVTSAHCILVDLTTCVEPSDELQTVQALFPNTPVVILTPPQFDDGVVIKLLQQGIADHFTLTASGLYRLCQYVTQRYHSWQHSPAYVPNKLLQSKKIPKTTAALHQVMTHLTSIQDSKSLIGVVLREYLHTLGLERGHIILLEDNDPPALSFHVVDELVENPRFETESEMQWTAIPLSEETHEADWRQDPLFQLLDEFRQAIIVPDLNQRQGICSSQEIELPRLDLWLVDQPRSVLIIPLETAEAVRGVMVIQAMGDLHPFDEAEILFGQAMAGQLSMALENITLYKAERERRRQAEILREAAYVVGGSLNMSEVLESLLDQLARIVEFDTAAVQLIEGRYRRLIAVRGFPEPSQVMGTVYPVALRATDPGSVVIHQRAPYIIDNVPDILPYFDHPLGNKMKSWLGVPLITRDQVIGIISIDHMQEAAYTESDGQLALAFGYQVAIALENARLHQMTISRIDRELEIAQEIQETLLPQIVPQVPGLEISGRILPARQVGGDFFHFFSVGGGNELGVAVGDVSGKGIPASLYMAVAITAIDIQVRTDLTPGELMNRLNQALYNRLQENRMNIGLQVATFAPLVSPEGDPAEIEEEARGVLMTTASGGMIAPIGATERGCRFLPVSGLPVGALPFPDHTYEDDMFLLDPFTTIIFTSDGIVEAQNKSGELFGFDRLEATINEIVGTRDAERIADYIINAAQIFMDGAEQSDDMTVVVVVKT